MRTNVISAGGIIAAGDHILVLRHHRLDGYSLIKGHVEDGETAAQTARREMAEEAARRAEIVRLLGVITRPSTERSGEVVNKDIIFYLMRDLGALATQPDEITEFAQYDYAVDHMVHPQEISFLQTHRAAILGQTSLSYSRPVVHV